MFPILFETGTSQEPVVKLYSVVCVVRKSYRKADSALAESQRCLFPGDWIFYSVGKLSKLFRLMHYFVDE